MTDIPRRTDLSRMTPAELAIRQAMLTVEEGGADVRLTDAVVLLGEAREAVADYIDGIDRRRSVHDPSYIKAMADVVAAFRADTKSGRFNCECEWAPDEYTTQVRECSTHAALRALDALVKERGVG